MFTFCCNQAHDTCHATNSNSEAQGYMRASSSSILFPLIQTTVNKKMKEKWKVYNYIKFH